MPETIDLLPTPGHLRTRGRQALALEMDFGRALEEGDVARLAEPRNSTPPTLKKLRDTHHTLAKMLASGKKPGEVSAVTGYSLSRISILQNDPAFKDLLEFYRDNAQAAYRDMHEQLANVSSDALNILRERMEDNPDALPDQVLLDTIKLGADRTGFGPQNKSLNVNLNVDLASRLEAGRKRVAELRRAPAAEEQGAPNATMLPAPSPATQRSSTED